jgi:hypothetical protein
MYKGIRIVAFLLVFLVIVTAPLLLNRGRVSAQPIISLETQAIAQMDAQRCVESSEYMRAEHMQMLDQWRDAVVREGKTQYISSDGQPFEMSLDDSCLKCHSNRSEFCDSCHDYASVDLYCWDCHDAGRADGDE